MDANWVRSIRDQCVGQGVAFFFKQWGGARKSGGRTLDNREWDEYPERRAFVAAAE
jgi:protein gp37